MRCWQLMMFTTLHLSDITVHILTIGHYTLTIGHLNHAVYVTEQKSSNNWFSFHLLLAFSSVTGNETEMENEACISFRFHFHSSVPWDHSSSCQWDMHWSTVSQASWSNLLWSGPTVVYLYSALMWFVCRNWCRRLLAFSSVQFPCRSAVKSASSACNSNEQNSCQHRIQHKHRHSTS